MARESSQRIVYFFIEMETPVDKVTVCVHREKATCNQNAFIRVFGAISFLTALFIVASGEAQAVEEIVLEDGVVLGWRSGCLRRGTGYEVCPRRGRRLPHGGLAMDQQW